MATIQISKRPVSVRRYLTGRSGVIFGFFAAFGWGAYLAATRHGVAEGLLGGDLAFIRYSTAGLILTPWLALHWRDRCANISWPRAAALTILAGPPLVMFVVGGARLTPAGSGILIELATMAACCILLATWWLKERLEPLRIAAIAVLFLRILAVGGPLLFCRTSHTWIGVLMLVAAGGMFAAFVGLVEKWKIEPLAATAVVSTASLLSFGPYYIWSSGLDRLSDLSFGMLAEQIVGQGLIAGIAALTAFSLAVRLLGLVKAALFPALTPAVAVLLGVGLTGEIPTALQAVFLALSALGAIFLIASMPHPAYFRVRAMHGLPHDNGKNDLTG